MGSSSEKNINKLTYDRHVIRNTRIQRFSNRQGNQVGKESRASRINKATCLKERQDRLAAQGEATSKGKLALSNKAEHNTALITVEMSAVLTKSIHPEDHVKVVHLQDSKIGRKATARNLNSNLKKSLRRLQLLSSWCDNCHICLDWLYKLAEDTRKTL